MEFNYYGEDYREFEKAFHELWIGEIPLTYLTDDLLKAMTKDKPYFILPAQQAVDGRKHVFYFEVVGDEYVYKECI